MNTALLRRVYRTHKIKKKKYRWFKQAKGMTQEVLNQKLATMKRQLTMAKNEGYRMIYLDETMFTRKTVRNEEWTRQGENVQVDLAKLDEPTLAMVCGISLEKGLEHFKIYPKSVKKESFVEYLKELREHTRGEKVCLFLDNLTAHTSDFSKTAMREMGYRWAWNVPYSPEYNPIELVFSKVKDKFRRLRAQKLVGLRQESHEALVEMAWKSVRKQDVVNCIKHV